MRWKIMCDFLQKRVSINLNFQRTQLKVIDLSSQPDVML